MGGIVSPREGVSEPFGGISRGLLRLSFAEGSEVGGAMGFMDMLGK